MRRYLLVIAVLAAVFAVGATAAAQTPDDVIDDVIEEARERHYYVDPGLPADEADISRSVQRARDAGVELHVILLGEDPAGGADGFAEAVLDRLGSGTVLVLSATQDGSDSTEFDPSVRADAQDFAFAAGGGDEGFVASFVDYLTGETEEPAEEDGEGGGISGWVLLAIIVGGPVGLIWWLWRRQKKKSRETERRRIAEARTEIEEQLSAMANTILEITDHVSATESTEDNEYLRQGSATFAAANEAFPDAQDLATLEALADRLDEARWQLDAAEALAEGREIPPKPEPEERHACFFDPTHRGPFEDAQITTAAGTKTVRVCRDDAERLRRGEEARTRMIEVGGRRIPASAAPRSHGGGGLGGLDVFSILVGGMGRARSYDWGGASRPAAPAPARSSPPPPRRSAPRRSTPSRARGRVKRTRRRRR